MTSYKLVKNDTCLRYGHLYIDEELKKAILLGYPLSLTKTEYQILLAIMKCNGKPVTASKISELCELELTNQNVSFHISSINRKAKAIGNRLLIKNLVKIGYFLNEEM